MSKSLWICLMALLIATGCKNQGGAGGKGLVAKDEGEKTLYATGVMLGQRLNELKFKESEIDMVLQGFRDSALGNKTQVQQKDFQMKIQQLFSSKIKELAEVEKTEGTKYIEEFMKKNPTAKKTASGLVYLVEKPGVGSAPKATDVVKVHYHGTLRGGKVFDSSVDRGEAVKFPLNHVIKGWKEGIQLVKKGGKIKLIIPAHLGYGNNGAPPAIPGGATLTFDVELLEINPKDAPKKASAPKTKAAAAKKKS